MNPRYTTYTEYMKRYRILYWLILHVNIYLSAQDVSIRDTSGMSGYKKMLQLSWKEIFYDSFEKDWKNKWFLDGKQAYIANGEYGMDFYAGPTPGQDTGHAVLWTRQIFQGNLRIEYDYTKLDTLYRYVTILYLLAEGSGRNMYDKDILKWNHLREIPAMRLYFEHMNALHISYAAYENSNTDRQNDYIRTRRYLPERGKGLAGTDVKPDYLRTGLFDPGEQCHITIIRWGADIYMHIKSDKQEKLCHWQTDTFPQLVSGRLGIRHMGGRAARYHHFKVWTL